MLVSGGNTFHHTGWATKDPFLWVYVYKCLVPGSIILYTTLTTRCFFIAQLNTKAYDLTFSWVEDETITTWWLNQPIGKNIVNSQIGSFPQVGVKIKTS